MRRVLLAAVPLVVACGPPEGGPDAGDDVDDGSGGAALSTRWTAPDVGDDLGDVVIDEVKLRIRDLRAVGDAAPEPYEAFRELELKEDPRTIDFTDAPPGRYSAIEFRLDGAVDGEAAWQMHGWVTIGGTDYELQVEDDVATSIDLPVDLEIAPGESHVVSIEVDVAVFEGVDWSTVPIEEGKVELDDDSPAMPTLRQRFTTGFSIAAIE